MKKKQQERISASLSKALEPSAKRRPSPALNTILSQYAPPAEPKLEEPRPTPPTAGTAPTPATSAAPARDFSRVANSIVRQAVPAGLFAGKSKQLYDYLYARTRGAVVPVRTVRVTKEALMRGADIGSERTLYKNLRRLVAVGLVQVRSLGGEHAGSEYTVLLPEEARQPAALTPPTPPTNASHKVQSLPTAQSGVGGVGLSDEAQEASAEVKTFSFKTKDRSDDEAAPFLEAWRHAERELTGKNSSFGDPRWRELSELLVAELKIAAARTGQVSSVPAFLTEHLRRRLWKKDKAQLERESKETAGAPAEKGIDASKCPDCRGTGWWYPAGEEKGVARCKHAKLK